MWGQILGAAISGGLNYLSAKKDRKAADQLNQFNADNQRIFAQNGIKWKVEDAKAAGIHPLYALGASTHNFQPVQAFSNSPISSLAQAGQDITRAIDSTRTNRERFEARAQELQIERGELENQLLRSQIRKLDQPGSGPPFPDNHLATYPAMAGHGKPMVQSAYLDDVPATDEFGNPVFNVGHGWVREPYRRTPAESSEEYWGDIPSEVVGGANIITRAYEELTR